MNPTHIGRSPKGRRIHLTDSRGWSACSRQFPDVTPIDQCTLKFDDPWCETCLGRLADDVESITIFGLEKLRRQESFFAGRWDARAEIRIGRFMLDYLAKNPAHSASRAAGAIEEWGLHLERDGREHLKACGGIE